MSYNTFDIFTPAKPAILNFVERDEINDTLVDKIRIPGLQIILEGEDGNGKSSLIINKLNQLYENFLLVDCLAKYSADDLLIQAFDSLNQFYTSEKENTKGKKAKAGISGSKIVSLDFRYEKDTSLKNRELRTVPKQITPINLVKALSEINGCLLIENIHRLKISEIGTFMGYMKIFTNALESNVVKIICTSKRNLRELLNVYPELANRLAVIKIGKLNHIQLRSIIENGMKLLNIQFHELFVEKAIKESMGEAKNIHNICLKKCLEYEIFETVDNLKLIE